MENFEHKINIPSSGVISETLGLRYDGDFVEANADASYSFSVPVITDDCPAVLTYMPLSNISKEGLAAATNQTEFISGLSEKKLCVIICRSFERVPRSVEISTSVSQDSDSFKFIAAVWDETEDPLMAASLRSCILLPEKSRSGSSEREPCYLDKEQLQWWLDASIPILEKYKILAG